MPKRIALLATAAALAITPALAQQSASPSMQQPAPQAQPGQPSMPKTQSVQPSDMKAGALEKFVSTQSADESMGSDVIGMRVRGGGDESIGSISDLLIDKEHKVKAAVIGVGGFLGIGQKNVAVSFDLLNIQQNAEGNQVARLAMTKDELEKAPEFKEREDTSSTAARPSGSSSTGTGTRSNGATPKPGL